MTDRRFEDRLRDAHRDSHHRDGKPGKCGSDETALRLVLGELDAGKARAFAAHAAICPDCADAWRLARELERHVGPQLRRPAVPWWLPVVAAAAALFCVAILFRGGVPEVPVSSGPVLRAPVIDETTTDLPDDGRLPVDGFDLSWSRAAEGARYDVRVTDARLGRLHVARGLSEPRHTVPATAFEGLPDDTRILWQVEVLLPDGTRRVSRTFRARIARP